MILIRTLGSRVGGCEHGRGIWGIRWVWAICLLVLLSCAKKSRVLVLMM